MHRRMIGFASALCLGSGVLLADAQDAVAEPPQGGHATQTTIVGVPSAYIEGYADKCIDVPGGQAADGAQLQIFDCNRTAAQLWTAGANGELMALGMCMDAAWGSSANGTKVQLAYCNGTGAQRWDYRAETGQIVGVTSGKCVDVRDWNPLDGAALQLWDCGFGQANQSWQLTGP